MTDPQPRARRQTIGEFERTIARLTGVSRELGTTLPAFARALSEFLDQSTVTVHLYEGEDDEFVLRGSTHYLPPGGETPRFRPQRTLAGLSVTEHRVVSLAENPGAGVGHLRAEEHVFPMDAGGRALGAVTVEQVAAERLSPVRLDRARRAILRFAEVLGAARREEALALRMNRLSAINEFGVVLLSALAPDDVPALATAMISFIMGTEGCLLRLRDGTAAGSSVRDAHGLRDPDSGREILKLEELASQQVLLSGQPLLVRDVARAERFRECSPRVRTFICHPLSGGGMTVGTITLFNKDPESPLVPARFDLEDQDVLLHLVRYVEKTLANAELFAKSRELAERDELTGLPDRSGFRSRLLTEISRARRFRQRFALVTCEVQTLATGGDTPHGRAAGRLMRRLAQVVRAEMREYDTVARIGERVFGIILPQMQDGTASPVARIRTAIEREVDQQRKSENIPDLQARFSQASFPDDGDSGEQMLSRVEQRG